MKYLLIELSENSVRFAISENSSITKFDFDFKDKKDYRYKEQLDEFLERAEIKIQEYDECSISWSSFRSTLVPSNIFGETNPIPLFHLCFGNNVGNSEIDYNRIPEQGIVNIFEIPLWVKSFFVIRFPKSVIHHEGSHLIRGMFSEPSFKLRSVIVLYDTYFLLAILSENKLQFYSSFSYQEIDDVVYHFMFTLQQKELLKDKGAIQLYSGVGSSEKATNELLSKLKSLQDFKDSSITVTNDIIINSQKQCV